MKVIIKEAEKGIYIPSNMVNYFNNRKVAFFDIETTGLNSKTNSIILIGFGYVKDDKYMVEQYFAEDPNEEINLLEGFMDSLKDFDTVVTYNGKRFDVPFVNTRLEINNLNCTINQNDLDLLPYVRANKDKLGLYRCNLKSVEKYLGIKREDMIDGGESINLYYEYLESREERIKDKILLHNFEDVYNLPGILRIFDEISFEGSGRMEDKITDKQKSFLNSLLKKNKYILKREIDMLTKIEASKLIDHLLKGSECPYVCYIEKRGN